MKPSAVGARPRIPLEQPREQDDTRCRRSPPGTSGGEAQRNPAGGARPPPGPARLLVVAGIAELPANLTPGEPGGVHRPVDGIALGRLEGRVETVPHPGG